MATGNSAPPFALVAALALAGCHALFPYAAPPPDSSAREQAARDADGALNDHRAPIERSRPRDGGLLADGPADDKPALDKPDPQPDGAPPASSACVAPLGQALDPYGTPSMVQCDYSSGLASISHCKAAGYCNAKAGWHLCTPGEFLAQGGSTLPPPSMAAWLAACVRDNGTVYSASTAPPKCSACDGSTVLSTQVYWECGGATTTLGATSQANVGVHTYGSCKRVGSNDIKNDGMWIAARADEPSIHGVLCCWP